MTENSAVFGAPDLRNDSKFVHHAALFCRVSLISFKTLYYPKVLSLPADSVWLPGLKVSKHTLFTQFPNE